MTLARRSFLAMAGALASLATVPLPLAAAARDPEVAEALATILKGREAEEAGIALEVPRVAENGAQVPVTIRVDSPMRDDDHVTEVHVLATRNPTPGIGRFRLSPALGRAELATRIRLAEEQEILVLAELSDGRVRATAAQIAVTVGGCAT